LAGDRVATVRGEVLQLKAMLQLADPHPTWVAELSSPLSDDSARHKP
jgi:hypothetical protein